MVRPTSVWAETPVTVACSKEANGAFLAWPLAGDDRRRFLRPAGGLYPASARSGEGGDELGLTWADGCLAVVMLRLAVAGCRPAFLNAGRLGGYLAAESDLARGRLGFGGCRQGAGEGAAQKPATVPPRPGLEPPPAVEKPL